MVKLLSVTGAVCVIAAPARMVPAKFDVVIVAASATHQTTLHG